MRHRRPESPAPGRARTPTPPLRQRPAVCLSDYRCREPHKRPTRKRSRDIPDSFTRCMEATTGFEPVIKALQASALPLGHVADKKAGRIKFNRLLSTNGADDGVRTRDPHLGKVVLYQLSHVRATRKYYTGSGDARKGVFQTFLTLLKRAIHLALCKTAPPGSPAAAPSLTCPSRLAIPRPYAPYSCARGK